MSVQSRVKVFESLAGPSSPTRTSSMPISIPRSPPILDDFFETPLSPTASTLPTIAPHTPPHPKRSTSKSPSPSPPNLGRKTSLIDLKDWVVDDGPLPVKPSIVKANGKINRSNGIHDTPRKDTYTNTAPLINFESPPKAPPLPPRKPSVPNLKSPSFASSSKPATSPKPALLPIATRRSDSLTVEHTYPPLKLDLSRNSNGKAGHAPASSVSSFHSVSLSSDTDPSTPGSVAGFIATYPVDHDVQENGPEHAEPDADSVSLDESFENVSTTSLGSPIVVSNQTMDWTKIQGSTVNSKPAPPKLPQRPLTAAPPSASSSRSPSIKSPPPHPSRSSSTASSASSFATATTSAAGVRRAPPPPPASRASTGSDRSSILSNLSNATTTSVTSSSTHNSRATTTRAGPGSKVGSLPKLILNNTSSLSRPTPVPAVARKRYEGVFDRNVIQRRKAESQRQKDKPSLLSPAMALPRKARQAAGWRGLSIDLLTGGEDGTHPLSNGDVKSDGTEDEGVDTHVGPEEQLEGRVVKLIWSRSKLGKDKLSNIWSECDPMNSGSLDRDAFVKGMWRIDEELRRAQLQPRGPGSATSLSSMSSWASAGRTPNPIRTSTLATARPRDLLR